MESVAQGGTPYRIYASVDEMNARAVGRSAGKHVDRADTYGPSLVELARQWQARLVKAARAIPDPYTVVLVMGDGSGRSVLQRLETIARHWNEQVRELQALSAAQPAGAPGACLTRGRAPLVALCLHTTQMLSTRFKF